MSVRKPGGDGGSTATPKSPHIDEPSSVVSAAAVPSGRAHGRRPCAVVGLGASIDPLDTFRDFFGQCPTDTGAAFVIVQHPDSTCHQEVCGVLAECTSMPTIEVRKGQRLEANHVYITPPNTYLSLKSGSFHLIEPQNQRSTRAPLDHFLQSLAEHHQDRAIGIVLAGTAPDGTAGLKALKEHGGITMAEGPLPEWSTDTPFNTAGGGAVDHVLSVGEMAPRLAAYLADQGRLTEEARQIARADLSARLDEVLQLLEGHLNQDLRSYKRNTLMRRVERRMSLRNTRHIEAYLSMLRHEPQERDALFGDMLIGVTMFLRDPEAWDELSRKVVPRLLEAKRPDQAIRVWVPGCATGEEAYTIAMLLLEALEAEHRRPDIQIFATDIDAAALEVAREGSYPASIEADLSPERLDRFFVRERDGFRVSKRVRECITFSVQNLSGDPPFSKLDLVSCRNVLIYMEPEAQQRVMRLLHFALHEGGFLLLGNSETATQFNDLFEPVSRKWRIYRRIGSVNPNRLAPLRAPRSPEAPGPHHCRAIPAERRIDLDLFTRNLLFEMYVPAAVLIDRNNEILNASGPTSRFLELPAGAPALDVLAMARDGLRTKLRGAIQKTIREDVTTVNNDARIRTGGAWAPVRITVKPLHAPPEVEGLLLVTFEELQTSSGDGVATVGGAFSGDDLLVRQLEDELRGTRAELQAVIEEVEATNEELKASNEEAMSMNEELQSANEELETSKEELQSLNEELGTSNFQLEMKIGEVETINNDLLNFMASTEIPALFLDTALYINRFTPAAVTLLHLIPADVGRPISDLAHSFEGRDPFADAQMVLATGVPIVRELRTRAGRCFVCRTTPYRAQDKSIHGVVVTFFDVTLQKDTEEALRESEGRFRALSDGALEGVAITEDGIIIDCNAACTRILGVDKELLLGHSAFEYCAPQSREEAARRVAQESEETYEVYALRGDGASIVLEISPRQTFWRGRKARMLALRDITARKEMEEALEAERTLLRTLIDNIPDSIYVKDTEGRFVTANMAVVKGNALDSVEALIGRTDADFHPPDLAAEYWRDEQHVIVTGRMLVSKEERVTRPGNVEQWLSTTKVPLRLPSGEIVGLVGIGRDITDAKRAEQALRDGEERYRELFDCMGSGVAVYEVIGDAEDFVFVDLNKAGERIERESRESLVGRSVFEARPGIEEFGLAEVFRQVWRTGQSQRHPISNYRDGRVSTWYDNFVYKLPTGQIVAVFDDVTEQKQSEEALRNSEARNLALLQAIPDTIFLVTHEGVVVDWRSTSASLPTTLEETLGRSCHEVLPADLADRVSACLRQVESAGHAETCELEWEADGVRYDYELRFVPCGTGRVLCMMRDISEQKRAQMTLHEYQERLQALLDYSKANIYVKGTDRRLLLVNHQFEKLVGRPAAEIVGRYDQELFPEADLTDIRSNDDRVLSGQVIEIEEELTTADGIRTYHSMKFPLRDQRGHIYALGGISTDITERKRAEEEQRRLELQVQQAQKLESLGVLAGGIAHDFNNLLTGILGNADLALMAKSHDGDSRLCIEEIVVAARQAAGLCQQMLAYSGKGKTAEGPINVNELGREMLRLLDASISKKARLQCHFSEPAPVILGDITQIRQVVMNLITNASEALGGAEGDIHLRTGTTYVAESETDGFLGAHALAPGHYVLIEVSDTGCGMDEDTLARIFDPFFTTKFTGRGLGLAAVLGIVRSHHGAIRVQSAPEQGSTFHLLFPAYDGCPDTRKDVAHAARKLHGNATILLVDDEDMVREVARRMLEREGFVVLTASDGREGIAVYRANADAIDLVILDMAMPCMGGEEAYGELRAITPDVRVLLSSGYSETQISERMKNAGLGGFIQKPYEIDAFLDAVYTILERQ